MSFKVKYGVMGSYEFQSGVAKLANAPVSAAKAITISQIVKQCKKASLQMRDEYKKDVLDVYAKKDDKGEIVTGENGFEVLEGKEDEHKAATKAFGEREFEFTVAKLHRSVLSEMKLTANEVDSIEMLIDMEAAETPAQVIPMHGGA